MSIFGRRQLLLMRLTADLRRQIFTAFHGFFPIAYESVHIPGFFTSYILFCISYPVYLIPAHLSFRSLERSIEGLWTLRYVAMLHCMKAHTA